MPLLQTDETSAGLTVAVPGPAGDTVSWVSNDSAIAGGAASPAVTTAGASSAPVLVQAGSASNGATPASVSVSTGTAVGSTGSGDVLFRTGNASGGDSGDVIIAPGLTQAGDTHGQALRRDSLGTAVYEGALLHEPLTNTAAQTISGAIGEFEFTNWVLSIPADTFSSGGALRYKVLVTALDAAGVSTLTVRVRLNFGGTGNIIAETAAVDPVTNDIFMIDGVAIFDSVGAAGSVRSSGFTMADTPDTTSNMEPYLLGVGSAVNTEAVITVSVTVQFSAANTDARLDLFQVSVGTGG